MVFHLRRIRFRICEDFARCVNHGRTRSRRQPFLGGNFGERVRVVDFDPVSKEQCLLFKIALDLRAQRSFPGVAQHHVKNSGRSGDDDQKDGEQLEEDAVLQFLLYYFGASKRYPAPRTVFRYRGFSGSGSIFSRIRRTYTSTDRGVTYAVSRQTESSR